MYASLARICHMYYNEGLTQQQIANRLHMSRIKVSRLLQQARTNGVVRIEIKYDNYYPDLENALQQEYGIQFIVADSVSDQPGDLRDSLGATAAEYLGRILGERDVVTVGWGTTMASVAEHLSSDTQSATFVPIVGGQANVGLDVHANSVAARMAANTGGRSEALFAPAVAESAEARQMLAESRPVARILNMAANAPICVFSLGAPFSPTSTITMIGYYTPTDIDMLRSEGAACDIISIAYYDPAGERCGVAVSSRTVSITEPQLRAIPHKVCVAGGPDKHEAIRIALDLGCYIDVMILDDRTARYLLGQQLPASP
ncbi:MAG: sugar-binding transcriptional regulator [Brooklawnia sp.]|jgi:deoxyribonucleoside regulator